MSKIINFRTKKKQADLDARVARIQESLDKINRLMAELRAVNTKGSGTSTPVALYVVK